MIDLTPQNPLDTLLPVSIGGNALVAATPAFITSIMPFSGQEKPCSKALEKAHDLALPAVGRIKGKADLRLIWTGQGQYFLLGTTPAAAAISEFAALGDQSDGWVVMVLEGAAASDILARLCPIDLRPNAFKRGHTARTELAHMMVVISKTAKGFEIMVMRSLAKTAVHHLQQAMESIAAQAVIS